MLRQFRPPVRALALALCFVFVCPSAAPASTLPPSSTASEPSESLPSNCPPPEVRITESEMNAQGNSTASDPASGCATGSAQLLDDEELAQLAARAEEPGAEVVGGALTNQQLTYIVIALATAVIVLIAK